MVAIIQGSFSKGELSPALYGRVDTSAYQVGLRTARNMIVHTSGGASNRPGLQYIGPVKDHTVAPRLIPFEFNTTDAYMLEFGNLYMRVIRNDAFVLETAITITGASKANPVVITSVAHGYTTGDQVFVDTGSDMTQINNRFFSITKLTNDTFSLQDIFDGTDVDGLAFTAWSAGGTIGKLFTLTTPYTTAQLSNLKYVQSADTMTFTHPSHEPSELTRTDHAVWSLDDITFAPSIADPTTVAASVDTGGSLNYKYKVTAIKAETFEESLAGVSSTGQTIASTDNTNPVEVTITSHTLDTGDEVEITGLTEMTELNGRRFIITDTGANTFTLDGEDGLLYTDESTGGANTCRATHDEALSSTIGSLNTITWAAVSGAQKYSVYRKEIGKANYGFLADTNELQFIDGDGTTRPDADTTLAPPASRNPFRVAADFPATVSYWEQRRVFGGTTNKPDTQFYTQTGNQSNMSVSDPSRADDAMTVTLNALQVNEIRHFVPGRDLLVLTSGSEWLINSGDNSGFAIDTLKMQPQSFWGSSHRKPVVVGGATLFVEESESTVRSIGYSLQIDGYLSSNLSLLADHLFDELTITEWGYSHASESRVYIVRSDGAGLTLSFDPEQEVVAWTTFDTDGDFESVAVLRHDASVPEDRVYYAVERTLNGATIRTIEKLNSRIFADVEDAFFVDSGLTLDSPLTITAATSANPVVITATAHGFSNDDEVDITGIKWTTTLDSDGNIVDPDNLNGGRFTVKNKTANTFEIQDENGNVDGSGFSAYITGGEVRLAVLTVSGLEHLANRTVVVLADGSVVSSLTVSSAGILTLTRKASRIHVGLPYISDLETLDPEAPQGTIQSLKKKIPSVVVRFRKSRGLRVGPDSTLLIEMKQREFEPYGTPTALLTGDKKITLKPKWNSNGRLLLRQKDPLPMTILAVVPDFDLSDDE